MDDRRRTSDPVSSPDVPADVLAWLDAVDVALLVVEADRLDVVAANAAARSLFGPRRFETLPVGVDAFGSTPAVEVLAGAIRAAEAGGGGAPPAIVVCQLAAGVRRLACAPARCPGLAGHWLFTLSDPGPAEEGDWRAAMEEIVNLLPVGIEVYDRHLNALFYNRRADDLFLYDEKAVLHHDEWFELGFPDTAERALRERDWADRLASARREPEAVQQTEWRMRCRDGTVRSVQFLFRFVGEHFVMVLWDMTERRQLEAELRRMAETDPLTGLANRRAFFDKAEVAFAGSRAGQWALSVLVIDIDHFKTINDRFGHAAGDEVIRKVAECCAATLRPSDTVARIGGEEFAVLLSAQGAAVAAATARRLLAAVTRRPISVAGREIPVAVSIGLAPRRPADDGFAAMLARADAALYVAKNTGRGRVVVGDGEEGG